MFDEEPGEAAPVTGTGWAVGIPESTSSETVTIGTSEKSGSIRLIENST